MVVCFDEDKGNDTNAMNLLNLNLFSTGLKVDLT
jgi:hypothetical protein